MMNAECFRLMLIISFWETRKVRGPFAVFFWAHNLACEFRARHFKIKLEIEKQKAKRIYLCK